MRGAPHNAGSSSGSAPQIRRMDTDLTQATLHPFPQVGTESYMGQSVHGRLVDGCRKGWGREVEKGHSLSWCHHVKGQETLSQPRNVTCLDLHLKARPDGRLEGR